MILYIIPLSQSKKIYNTFKIFALHVPKNLWHFPCLIFLAPTICYIYSFDLIIISRGIVILLIINVLWSVLYKFLIYFPLNQNLYLELGFYLHVPKSSSLYPQWNVDKNGTLIFHFIIEINEYCDLKHRNSVSLFHVCDRFKIGIQQNNFGHDWLTLHKFHNMCPWEQKYSNGMK
jgi:hypothetical protein